MDWIEYQSELYRDTGDEPGLGRRLRPTRWGIGPTSDRADCDEDRFSANRDADFAALPSVGADIEQPIRPDDAPASPQPSI